MATVNVTYFKPAVLQGATAVYSVNSDATNEVITSSATSQSTTATATGKNYVRVVTTGGNVWLAFGTNPTAVTNTGRLLVDGVPEVYYLDDAWKVAVIN